jgi:molybdopterin synthase catalytic subunit
MLKRVRIQRDDFDIGVEWADVRADLAGRAGAMAAFVGVVRDHFDTDAVQRLDLEHYPGMTEKSIEAVLQRADVRWTLDSALVIHRVGPLNPADQIVLVITAARHRQAALESCAYIIDLLKTEAVFWKREVSATGARWIDSTPIDVDRTAKWKHKL